jgi:hypothetical protein
MNGFREGGGEFQLFFIGEISPKRRNYKSKSPKMKLLSRVSIARSQENRRKFSLDFYIYFSK